MRKAPRMAVGGESSRPSFRYVIILIWDIFLVVGDDAHLAVINRRDPDGHAALRYWLA